MSRSESIKWEAELEQAKQRARDERRDVLLYFSKQP
jgi:hypothetical protein